jgi:hypothetical protein
LSPEQFSLIVERGVVRGIEAPLGGASGGLILVEHAETRPPLSARQKTLQQALTLLQTMGKKLGTPVRTQEPKRAAVIENVVSLSRSARRLEAIRRLVELRLKTKGNKRR